jgi:leukotriene-A4 hydrolase
MARKSIEVKKVVSAKKQNVLTGFRNGLIIGILLLFLSCGKRTKQEINSENLALKTMEDTHSYAQPELAFVKHLNLKLTVDFDETILKGIAEIDIEKSPTSDSIVLDTKDLQILEIIDADTKRSLNYVLGKKDSIKGSPLIIKLSKETKRIAIRYQTGKDAEALQWLSAEQTLDKKSPFLFTQSQAILARTWIPIQDSPGIRFTYSAEVKVPKGLIALMSAENPQAKNDTGIYRFSMPQPIPAYLMALSVGDLEFKSLGKRSGVYAESGMIKKAANEFSDLEKMIDAAEQLYGDYKWGRYDLIVLPPSFPFGGMENPRLTFATPTIIVGDKSLTSLVAHELAHSWSGNLVTNATWNDFWLNEGFTVYFENRIMEKLYGKDYEEMLAYLGYQSLEDEITEMGETNPDTRLKTDLKGRNPDDGVTDIAYEKGNLFLRHIESIVGREKWDLFVKKYFNEFQFKSITTEQFLDYLNKELINGNQAFSQKIQAEEWIYKPGLPADHPVFSSKRFEIIKKETLNWLKNSDIDQLKTANWSSHEWVYFINNLPKDISISDMKSLDKAFNVTHSKNAEIQFSWYLLAIKRNYSEAFPALVEFLKSVGRRKFILPLYKELAKNEEGKKLAKETYKEARPLYHFVARNSIDQVLL